MGTVERPVESYSSDYKDGSESFISQQKSVALEMSRVSCTKFPIFCVDNSSEDCVIQAVVLNYWDNICGPRIHSAWTVNKSFSSDGKSGREEYMDWEAVGFMGRQILCGEIMKRASDLFLEAKFYDSAEKKMALFALVFGAIDQGEMKAHSLCLITDYGKLKQFLQWRDVCFQWLSKCVLQLRVTLANNATTGYTIVKEDLRRLVEIMRIKSSLMDIKVGETHFSNLEDPPMFEFVHRSLVAFLCQGQQAVVVGNERDGVNRMIKTLAMFASPHRFHRITLLESNFSQFAPELHIQGLHKSQMTKLLANVLWCPQPTAFIDCDTMEVYFISWCEDYHEVRKTFVDSQLTQLWSETPVREPQFGDIFRPAKVSKSLIQDFLSELLCLPDHLKKPFVVNFLKILNRKILLFSQCLENYLRQTPKRMSVGSNQSDMEVTISIIRNKLHLSSDWDIHIISSSPYNPSNTCF